VGAQAPGYIYKPSQDRRRPLSAGFFGDRLRNRGLRPHRGAI